jgi:protein-disulfide isomerase
MDEVKPDTPPVDRPMTPVSPAPRPPAGVPPPRRSATSLLPLIALLAVGVLWLRTEGQISQLRDDQRRLSQDVGALKPTEMIDVAGAPALGPGTAPVTLVEFSDYECPFCVRHFRQTMPQIEANFIKPGRIRYVFRDYPIDELHPEAIRAHETARCALEQSLDKYWLLHRSLFSSPGTHTKENLDARAREAGLDTAAIQACLASGRVTAGIRRSSEVASALGANGTPQFFVGLRERGSDQVRVLESIKGAHPYSVFEQAINRALDQAK